LQALGWRSSFLMPRPLNFSYGNQSYGAGLTPI
jgi:hypothetical protein